LALVQFEDTKGVIRSG